MKEEMLIAIFLLLGPLLDVSVFYDLNINLALRGFYLLSIIILMIKRKLNLKLLGGLLVFSIAQLVFLLTHFNYSILDSISCIFKFLYLPVSILYFKDFRFKKYKKEKILTIILFSYLSIYLFSYITKLGASAYDLEDGKVGYRGMFTSINELSAIIVGLLPIVINYLKENKKYYLIVLLCLLSLITGLLLGTKVLLLGLIIVLIYFVYKDRNRIFNLKKKEKIWLTSIFLLLVSLGVFFFTRTNVYNNMEVQRAFFKVDNILSFDYINRVIFNDRLTFLKDNFMFYKNSNIIEMLLGIGLNNIDIKRVELDIFDIIFRFGLIGFIMFTIPFIKLNYKIKGYYLLSFILFILISVTSGHVLIYPNVCIYISLIFSKQVKL